MFSLAPAVSWLGAPTVNAIAKTEPRTEAVTESLVRGVFDLGLSVEA